MNTGERIQRLRKENNMTQENLADYLQVSRQSISKWEQDISYPETDKLIKLAEIFKVSVDYLLRGTNENNDKDNNKIQPKKSYHYEYKSKKTLFGYPLVHINIGKGLFKARGLIAIGNISRGLISLGFLSTGILSLGFLSLGLLSLGLLAFGLFALGNLAIGIITIGTISIGILSIGAISIGLFSYGALSIGKYVAIGDYAIGDIAIGVSYAKGKVFTSLGNNHDRELIISLIDNHVPKIWSFFKEICKLFL